MVVASHLELNRIWIFRSAKRSRVDERIVYQNQILSLMMNKGVNWENSILIDRFRIFYSYFLLHAIQDYCLRCVNRKAIFNSKYLSGEYFFFNHLSPSSNLKSKIIFRWWRHRPQHCASWMLIVFASPVVRATSTLHIVLSFRLPAMLYSTGIH